MVAGTEDKDSFDHTEVSLMSGTSVRTSDVPSQVWIRVRGKQQRKSLIRCPFLKVIFFFWLFLLSNYC